MAKSLKPFTHSFCSRVGVVRTGWAAGQKFEVAKINPGNRSDSAAHKFTSLVYSLQKDVVKR